MNLLEQVRLFPICLKLPFENRLYCCMHGPDSFSVTPIKLPLLARDFPPERIQDFLSGRRCAQVALSELNPTFSDIEINMGSSGAPLWPDGYLGSISHILGQAIAIAAPKKEIKTLGIDIEKIISQPKAKEIKVYVMPDDFSVMKKEGLTETESVTIAFSVKESAFKALYGTKDQIFEFEDIQFTAFDRTTGFFTLTHDLQGRVHILNADTLLTVVWR